MLVNCHADGQTFKFWPRPAQEFQFQFLFWTLGLSLTAHHAACRGHGQACLDLAGVTNCCWIHPTLYLKWMPRREWRDTNRIGLRPQKLVEASSNLTTINLLKLPNMWRFLMRVEKRLMVLSLVPEPTWRNIQHLKDYPAFQVFFFDLRTLAVSWSTRYASAQRAELRDSCTACARGETSKACVPRYEHQQRLLWYQRTSKRTNWYAVSLKSKNEKWTRRARMSSSTNYYAGGTDTRLHRQNPYILIWLGAGRRTAGGRDSIKLHRTLSHTS